MPLMPEIYNSFLIPLFPSLPHPIVCHCYLQNMPQTNQLLSVSYASSLVTCINHLTYITKMVSQMVSLFTYFLPFIFSPKGSQHNLYKHKFTHFSPLLESFGYILNHFFLKKSSSIYFIAPCVTCLLVITTKNVDDISFL